MINNIAIDTIMTKQVITVAPNDLMTAVFRYFNQQNIHHLPVVNKENKVVGIISKADYLKTQNLAMLFDRAEGHKLHQSVLSSLLVEDVMTKSVTTLAPDAPLQDAVNLFQTNQFHALPIVNEAHQLVGLLSTYDLIVHAYALPTTD